jgi:hypothetical protein
LEFGDGVGGKWKTSEEVLAGILKGIWTVVVVWWEVVYIAYMEL